MKLWKGADPDLVPTDRPIRYWIAIDPETGNPTGNACWAYYPGDEPAAGFWIEVEFTGKDNSALIEELSTNDIDPNRTSGAV